MKLATFCTAEDPAPRVGVLREADQHWVDVSEHFPNMQALIDAGADGLAKVRMLRSEAAVGLSAASVKLWAPLPLPRQMRDAMTFELHLQQSIRAMAALRVGPFFGRLATALGIARVPRVWYEQPTYYKCNRFSVVGHEADVLWPTGAELMDYECEIAVVIGRTGKDIPRERAMEHVFGYTIFNDMSARDLQSRETAAYLGPAKGKDFDTGNVLGPVIVTSDELDDPYDLTMIARVDGAEWGRGSTRDMYHRWEDVIAHISRNETLHAGEVIGSGTVGNGCGLEQRRFLHEGALVELEVSGIGVLRNRLVRP